MPRVEELIKREITSILNKDLCLPNLGFITLTRVQVTKDLKMAHVYVSVFGDPKKQASTMQILNEQSHTIYHLLKPRFRMKFIPNVTFVLDNSAAYSDHISRQLMDIKRLDKEE